MFVNETFVYWATERDNIRKRREAGLPRDQWTVDPIFKTYRFCNVSREDDRVTKWIKEHIRDPFNLMSSEEVLFKAVCLARFINKTDTLGTLLVSGALGPNRIDFKAVSRVVTELQRQGHVAFSSAYMVRSDKADAYPEYGTGKIAYLAAMLDHTTLPKGRTRQAFTTELQNQNGFGSFMAGQVSADLAYTRILQDAPDHMTWAPLGPGAIKGMNRALGRPVDARLTQDEYVKVGLAQMAKLPQELVEDRKLTLHDVASNVNCETSKYLGLAIDGKAPKRKFT